MKELSGEDNVQELPKQRPKWPKLGILADRAPDKEKWVHT